MLRDGLIPYEPGESLRDPAGVLATVMDCLIEGDHLAAQEVLVGGLSYLNKARVVKHYGIPRRTLYNLITYKSVPTLELVAKACFAMKQESLLASKKGASAVDSPKKNARITADERKALPVGSHTRL